MSYFWIFYTHIEKKRLKSVTSVYNSTKPKTQYTLYSTDHPMAQFENKDVDVLPVTDEAVKTQIKNEFDTIMRIVMDPDLEPLRSRIQLLYNSFTTQIEMEKDQLKKCMHFKKQKQTYINRINNCNKMIMEENRLADNHKKDLEKRESETEELKKKEADVRDLVAKYKNELAALEREAAKFRDDIEIKHQSEENDLKKLLEQQRKYKDELNTKLISLRSQDEYGQQEILEQLKVSGDNMKKIADLQEQIVDIQAREDKEKLNKEKKKEQLYKSKTRKDQLAESKAQLDERVKQLEDEIIATANDLKKVKADKDEQTRIKVRLLKEQETLMKENARKEEEVLKQEMLKKEKEEALNELNIKYAAVLKEKIKGDKMVQASVVKVSQMETEVKTVMDNKDSVIKSYQIQKQALESLKTQREKHRSEIGQLVSKRMQLDKEYKSQQNKEHEMKEVTIEQLNKHKKVENEVASYQIEADKLAKIVEQLKREQEKYGIEASQAHAKYYQTIEEVKIKNTQILNLQKENQEVESKSKHQQNLYEAVRSDRNLYSKEFIKSKEETSELRKKYKRMVYEVEQLREEIKSKDQELVEHDKEFRKIETENVKIMADKERAQAQIKNIEEVIKTQEDHIGHLKKIIQQAKAQKLHQQKDYDMVVNERDILGTQLIKRNQQLAVVYEKIKLANSNLTKGDLHYRKLQQQFKALTNSLNQLRHECKATEDQIRCIEDLKAEISFKEKELLNQRAKVRALQDEIANPMNVHRWRKLQATDQDNYERILKIQTLQRRLIAKTEEVQAKESLIREKEKIFLDFKNILARQPGAEIHEQLETYRKSLKKKSEEMKKMKQQLQESSEEVERLKFELNRLNGEMQGLKKQYFQIRAESEQEVMKERDYAKEMIELGQEAANNQFGVGMLDGIGGQPAQA